MWGRYGGSTETALAQDLTTLTRPGEDPTDRLLGLLRQQRGELEVKPGDFAAWSRGARFFPILYMLTRVTGARDWGTGELLDQVALGQYSDLEIHHVFPKKVLYEAGYTRQEVNAVANFTFLTGETNRKIGAKLPSDYFLEYQALNPGAIESHWISMDPELWSLDRYMDFLEHRRVALSAATNEFLSELYAGHAPERETPAVPVSPATFESEEPVDDFDDDEERIIGELQTWLGENGFAIGELDHELVEADGSAGTILDIAWPRGLQPELSEPIALLLNEPSAVVQAATDHGYRPFADAEKLRAYAEDLAAATGRLEEQLVR